MTNPEQPGTTAVRAAVRSWIAPCAALVLTACTAGASTSASSSPGGTPATDTATTTATTGQADPTRTAATPNTPTGTAPIPTLPPTSGVFDYQLGGTSDTVRLDGATLTIDVVVRDATAEPLPGAYSVCYVNGFQSQPDQADVWLDQPALLLRDAGGTPVVDPDWPDELVLDPSTPAQRDGILAIVGPQIESCADRGFDAVEIDNLDTWTRFDQIPEDGALALAADYVSLAHDLGLAIAQKNAAEVADVGHDDLGFDFAIAEECFAWDECDAYLDAYDGRVLEIEYPDALDDAGTDFGSVCASSHRASLTILRDRDLVSSTSAGYRYDSC
ncbi:endo alpha-1,4 polygalactosaminidase [Actinotalea sp. M2MS4P-6]|uniref:endo alpha-1,4 polygalactosaminidase n=1 Tax=Actinotalea sp. M2MS4P-6 TaxID=2983762 RepID=UPI0021E3D92A|nr:endo alpha-1,4 polygalactosaminidase [Actinotalea sp. M2MS4P-6]MCV2393075.1 endo alpha-1,4 polygalactosaminidase [Actinotalea sp. M2MS4P-6]